MGTAKRGSCAAHFVQSGADSVGGGGDVVTPHELLGEGLARLQPRGSLRGSEDAQAEAQELVYEAERERQLGADDGKLRPLRLTSSA